jgi:uncharacterized membrane protein
MKNLFSHKGLKDHPVITTSTKKKLTISQRASDGLSGFMGSWSFLLVFLVFIVLWMAFNVVAWIGKWDPYPFILLNLALSCLSALQAPIILMSQNRQTERDRVQAKYDYAVNRKTEREVEAMRKDLASIKRVLTEIRANIK